MQACYRKHHVCWAVRDATVTDSSGIARLLSFQTDISLLAAAQEVVYLVAPCVYGSESRHLVR